MTKDISRRKFLKQVFSSISMTICVSALGYTYARFIEPKFVEIKELTISHDLIPRNFNNIKIVQFSDTHIGHYFDLDHFHSIVHKINKLEPDIVFFTGDLLDNPKTYTQSKELIPLLEKVRAPFGKFAIYGNHDHGGYGSDLYKEIMSNADFHILTNSSQTINLAGDIIAVAGLDDMMLGKPDFQKTLQDVPASTYTILLAHEPDGAPRSAALGANLQLSGHSHGGQIQLPFLGPIITPPLGRVYYEGKYEVGATSMPLYVNRGLGTTRLPFRLLCRPEITLFTLKSNTRE